MSITHKDVYGHEPVPEIGVDRKNDLIREEDLRSVEPDRLNVGNYEPQPQNNMKDFINFLKFTRGLAFVILGSVLLVTSAKLIVLYTQFIWKLW